MAKQPMIQSGDEDGAGRRRRSSVLGSLLLGLIALSMLGFGVNSFGGGASRIGTVGDQEITVNQYASALQSEVRRFSQMVGGQVALGDLLAAGVGGQILGDLVRRAALNGEMGQIGLSVGDAELAAELVKNAAFQGVDGRFDRAAYGETLARNNLTEAEFEENLRADIARGLLQVAVSGGAKAPQAVIDALLAYAGETREISFVPLTEADLPQPLPTPTPADLQAEYDAAIADYTRPEAKRIQYIALLPDDLAQEMPADEAAIAALYQERIDDYVIPEKRLVERLVYPSAADAADAKAKLDAGASFDDLVKARNLTLTDIDLGDVAKADLGAAGEAVFALTEPGVVGPLDSDLGPALFRMNAILAAQETPLDAVRADLALELGREAARREIASRIDAIDDALAGGATLADLAQSESLTLATTDYAKGAEDNDPIAGYGAFIKAADALAMGDFPEAIVLEDGGVVAMTLQEIIPPTPRPLADVSDRLRENWRAKALNRALESLAEAKLAEFVQSGDWAAMGAAQRAKITRNDAVPNAPQALVTAAFAASDIGTAQVVTSGAFIALMRLEAIAPAQDNPEAADLRAAFEAQLAQSLGADVLELYGRSIETAAGISLDQNMINSVHSQLGN